MISEQKAHTPLQLNKLPAVGLYAVYDDGKNKFWIPIKANELGALLRSGDFKTIPMAADAVWTCPKGTYEIYVYLQGQNAVYINDEMTAAKLMLWSYYDGWYPAYHSEHYASDLMMSAMHFCTLSHGWEVSEGDTVKVSAGLAWKIRYRKVG